MVFIYFNIYIALQNTIQDYREQLIETLVTVKAATAKEDVPLNRVFPQQLQATLERVFRSVRPNRFYLIISTDLNGWFDRLQYVLAEFKN